MSALRSYEEPRATGGRGVSGVDSQNSAAPNASVIHNISPRLEANGQTIKAWAAAAAKTTLQPAGLWNQTLPRSTANAGAAAVGW